MLGVHTGAMSTALTLPLPASTWPPTGELEPQDGTVWKHPNLRIAYVAQHAFHHLERHLDKVRLDGQE